MKNLLLAAIFGVFCCAADLRADYLLSGSQNGLSASANFSVSGNALVITLTNTSALTANSSGPLLTGFYFNTTGSSPSFSYANADTPSENLAVIGSQNSTASSSSGTTWEFDKGGSGTPFSMPYGFVSAAVTSVCTGSACGTTTTGNTQLANNVVSGGLLPNTSSVANAPSFGASVIFTLYVPPHTTFTTADISGVAFQFGNAGLTDSDFVVLPEPASYFTAIALLLCPVAWFKRRRDKKSRPDAESGIRGPLSPPIFRP